MNSHSKVLRNFSIPFYGVAAYPIILATLLSPSYPSAPSGQLFSEDLGGGGWNLVSDICGLGLIMSDFLIVQNCKCAKCYCFDNFTTKEAEVLQAHTACVRTVTTQRDGGKSACLLQSWLDSII